MTTASDTVPEGYMKDTKGRLVPLEAVKPEHLLEDELVRRLHEAAAQLAEQLAFNVTGDGTIPAGTGIALAGGLMATTTADSTTSNSVAIRHEPDRNPHQLDQ
ncbi:MAG: hypothetical protein ABF636_09260 [Acetobacter sp.]|uniref:DUF3164 family protein n=1 Tax=Acetobacter sp. TaxID=440 RepID=UPI0039EAA797